MGISCKYKEVKTIIDHDHLEGQALSGNIKSLFSNLIEVAPYLSDEQSNVLSNIQDPEKIVDKAISLMNIQTSEKQSILKLVSVLWLVPNMDIIVKLCQENNVLLSEDACESMGSAYKQKYLGTFGLMSSYST